MSTPGTLHWCVTHDCTEEEEEASGHCHAWLNERSIPRFSACEVVSRTGCASCVGTGSADPRASLAGYDTQPCSTCGGLGYVEAAVSSTEGSDD